MAKKILLGLTTITPGAWRNKIKEIDELGLKEIALFLTGLEAAERKELYGILEKTGLEKIPHVHLRADMTIDELDYLTGRFRVRVFNIHSAGSAFPFKNIYGHYVKNIFVENGPGHPPSNNDLATYAGLCLDLSHWEAVILEKGADDRESLALKKMASEYKIGINHLSAVKSEKINVQDRFTGESFFEYDSHWLDDLSEVDYVKKYQDYLAEIISLELENPFKRQLEVKKYLEKMLKL